MGFCTAEQTEKFLTEAPQFERMIVDEGIHFFKFWLNIGEKKCNGNAFMPVVMTH